MPCSRARTLPPGVMFPDSPLAKVYPSLMPEWQHPGLCTDHPSRVDFSRVLGRGAANMLLPVHDHFETTCNGNRPEWHNLHALMVSNGSARAPARAVAAGADVAIAAGATTSAAPSGARIGVGSDGTPSGKRQADQE